MRTYEFRGANGRVCCSSNDVRNLCDKCKAKARAVTAQPLPRTAVLTTSSPAARAPLKTEDEWLRELAVETGDPFLPTMVKAPRQPQPTDDPTYHPYGNPPDGFALAARRESKR